MKTCVIIGCLVGLVLGLAGAWISGFDFNERTAKALEVFIFVLLCGGCGAAIGMAVRMSK